ncbi:MAG: leucine-rich repeat protein [Lachnospiraceae bacterium]|nr:leucine-rich repeat domain-containing protein [Robinsoniella sp.]MDY3765319.1 leucine-rich repeat protein [Lachnospiraceae bacterium]
MKKREKKNFKICGIFYCVIMICFLTVTLLWGEKYSYAKQETYSDGLFEYLINEDGTLTIVGYHDRNRTTLVIPESIAGMTVTAIECGAFANEDLLVSITIPDSVQRIEDGAFRGAFLQEFQVSQSHPVYEQVDGILFEKTTKRLVAYPAKKTDAEYIIPEGTTEIGAYAFSYNKNLTNLTIPDTVTEIGEEAFSHCSNLKTMEIPQKVKEIKAYTFASCNSLEHVTIPEGTERIGEAAFLYCSALTDMILPLSLTEIGERAFDGVAVENMEVAPGNIAYEEKDGVLFEKATQMLVKYPSGRKKESYAIPEDTIGVKKHAFYECRYLETVYIPPSVSVIEEEAFEGNAALKMDIPEEGYVQNWAISHNARIKNEEEVAETVLNNTEKGLESAWNFKTCKRGGEELYVNGLHILMDKNSTNILYWRDEEKEKKPVSMKWGFQDTINRETICSDGRYLFYGAVLSDVYSDDEKYLNISGIDTQAGVSESSSLKLDSSLLHISGGFGITGCYDNRIIVLIEDLQEDREVIKTVAIDLFTGSKTTLMKDCSLGDQYMQYMIGIPFSYYQGAEPLIIYDMDRMESFVICEETYGYYLDDRYLYYAEATKKGYESNIYEFQVVEYNLESGDKMILAEELQANEPDVKEMTSESVTVFMNSLNWKYEFTPIN